MTPEKLAELEKTLALWDRFGVTKQAIDLAEEMGETIAALREAWREIQIRDLRLQAYAERDETRPDLLAQLEAQTERAWKAEKERDEARAALGVK